MLDLYRVNPEQALPELEQAARLRPGWDQPLRLLAICQRMLGNTRQAALTLEQAVEDTSRESRRYAKRQLTWFRADERIQWIDVTELSTSQAASRVLELLESGESRPFSA